MDWLEYEDWGEQVGGMAVGHRSARSEMPRGEIIVGESERILIRCCLFISSVLTCVS